jgi:hypothetical protein
MIYTPMKKLIEYKRLGQINIADCYLQWQYEDGSKCSNPQQTIGNIYAVVMHPDGLIHRDHIQYPYIHTAWNILFTGRPGKWKTAKFLTTLRQAIRENRAQGMGLKEPELAATKNQIFAWLAIARHFDKQHHGANTF